MSEEIVLHKNRVKYTNIKIMNTRVNTREIRGDFFPFVLRTFRMKIEKLWQNYIQSKTTVDCIQMNS